MWINVDSFHGLEAAIRNHKSKWCVKCYVIKIRKAWFNHTPPLSLWLQVVPGVQQQSDSRWCGGAHQGLPCCWCPVHAGVLVASACCSLKGVCPCLLYCPAQRDQSKRRPGRRYEDGPEQQAVLAPLQLGRFEAFFTFVFHLNFSISLSILTTRRH